MDSNFIIERSKEIDGVIIFKTSSFSDDRGNIWTSYLKNEIEKFLPDDITFNHDKFSRSKNNVLRGIHGDNKSWKLVTCIYGEIQQVVLDCKIGSNTYGKHQSFLLNENKFTSILIPPSYGNAYHVISNEAIYHYKIAYIGSYYDVEDQFTIKWDDPKFSIDWKFKNKPILSNRDEK